jgi:hypothetical protein
MHRYIHHRWWVVYTSAEYVTVFQLPGRRLSPAHTLCGCENHASMRARAYSSALGSARSFQQRRRTRVRIGCWVTPSCRVPPPLRPPPADCPTCHLRLVQVLSCRRFHRAGPGVRGRGWRVRVGRGGVRAQRGVGGGDCGTEEDVSAVVQARRAAGDRGLSRPSMAMRRAGTGEGARWRGGSGRNPQLEHLCSPSCDCWPRLLCTQRENTLDCRPMGRSVIFSFSHAGRAGGCLPARKSRIRTSIRYVLEMSQPSSLDPVLSYFSAGNTAVLAWVGSTTSPPSQVRNPSRAREVHPVPRPASCM